MHDPQRYFAKLIECAITDRGHVYLCSSCGEERVYVRPPCPRCGYEGLLWRADVTLNDRNYMEYLHREVQRQRQGEYGTT